MRNPALRLVGIAASPGGGGVFGTRAEEELRLWLESRLDALGIDPVAYSRFVLSLLRCPDSALSPLDEDVDRGRRNRVRPRTRLQGDREQRRAVVQCLTNAADQKCGVESLVDELCAKLRDLEGGGSNDEKGECRQIDEDVKKNTTEVLTPRDRALRYYNAFPALQPTTPKKTPHKKDKNSGATDNNYNNNNNNYNNNNIKNRSIGVNVNNNKTTSNKNNNNSSSSNSKTRLKKNKMSMQKIDSRHVEEKETFGFAKSLEREREKEREMELDQLRLAQLQAKFDESLEALWDSGPGNAQNKASIWAAPSLSIPSGPLWPVDTGEVPLILPINDTISTTNTPYQDSIVDDSPIIPWDIDSIGVEKYGEEKSGQEKIDYKLNWSDYVGDGPWSWKDLGNNLINVDKTSPQKKTSGFLSVIPCKSPVVNNKESNSTVKSTNLHEVEEDLLTSARTHFRPIKDDGHWADGTTFPVNNNIEKVAYRRSESGHLFYLPDEENPYMKYRESVSPLPIASTRSLTLKFRVRQCDKGIQTDPIRSPVKRRILAEVDHFYYSLMDDPEDYIFTQESDDTKKDSFTIGQLGWIQPSLSLFNDRKRRHSSSFNCRPLAALRPLTL